MAPLRRWRRCTDTRRRFRRTASNERPHAGTIQPYRFCVAVVSTAALAVFGSVSGALPGTAIIRTGRPWHMLGLSFASAEETHAARPGAPAAPDGAHGLLPKGLQPLDRRALTRAHAAEIEELRTACADVRGAGGAEPCGGDAQHVLAHLRAAGLDRARAEARLRATAAWRGESGIEAKMADRSWLAGERELRRVLLYDFLGGDTCGRPMLVERVGAWNIADVRALTEDLDRFVLLNAMVSEALLRAPRPDGAPDPRGVVVVMDMAGLSSRHLCSGLLRAFAAVSQVVQSYYPDVLAHIFVVNAPWVFTAVKTMISPFLASETHSKVHVSSGVPDELRILGGSCLPKELRGDRLNVFPYDEDAEVSDYLST